MINLFLANVDPCHCDTTFEPARCYKDRTDQRLLQNYILNERDPTLSNYRGKSIEWTNWQNYLPEFICRCANEAKLLGFDVFGIQFYGKEFFASIPSHQQHMCCILYESFTPVYANFTHLEIMKWAHTKTNNHRYHHFFVSISSAWCTILVGTILGYLGRKCPDIGKSP